MIQWIVNYCPPDYLSMPRESLLSMMHGGKKFQRAETRRGEPRKKADNRALSLIDA